MQPNWIKVITRIIFERQTFATRNTWHEKNYDLFEFPRERSSEIFFMDMAINVSVPATLLLCYNDCYTVCSKVVVFEHSVIFFLATADKWVKLVVLLDKPIVFNYSDIYFKLSIQSYLLPWIINWTYSLLPRLWPYQGLSLTLIECLEFTYNGVYVARVQTFI